MTRWQSSMGGVAGHAGLFSNARDLSRYCRMVLNDGWLEGARVLQPRMVRQMVAPQSPPGKPDIRGLGWDIQSRYSSPKGARFSARALSVTRALRELPFGWTLKSRPISSF